MKISTRGRYALRMMLDMVLSDSDKPVRVKEIAERQEISEKYMEQIMSVLNKAGFVRSVRGPQGGYFLTKKPEEYTVGMILRLTEGSLSPVDCLEEGASGVQSYGQLYHHSALEKAGWCHPWGGGSCDSTGSGGLEPGTESRLYYLKSLRGPGEGSGVTKTSRLA